MGLQSKHRQNIEKEENENAGIQRENAVRLQRKHRQNTEKDNEKARKLSWEHREYEINLQGKHIETIQGQ